MRTISISLFGFVAFSMSFFNVATAAPVVQNNSFESPAVSPGFTTTDPSSWVSSGFGGHGVDSAVGGASLSGADGVQYFYGDGQNSNEVLSQDLGVSFAPATKYTVNLLGAYRDNGCCGTAGVFFGLDSSTQTPGTALAGATVGHIAIVDEEANPQTFIAASAGPNSNVFTFTTGPVVPSGDIVAYIESDGTFSGGGRLTVDDFVLTATMVPEPSSIVAILGLCATGLVVGLRYRLRRQPSQTSQAFAR
jgi:hypothetical protein